MHEPYLDRERFVLGDTSEHFDTLNCERIAQRSHIHGWSVEPHFHEGLAQLFFFSGGEVRGQLDIREAVLTGMSLVWMPAMTSHGFLYPPDMPGWVLTISNADMNRIVTRNPALTGWISEIAVLTGPGLGPALAELQTLVEGLEQEFNGNNEGRSIALSALLDLILIRIHRALRADSGLGPAATDRRFLLVKRYQDLIDANAAANLPVSDYAEKLMVTPSYLTRTVKALTGRTAGDLIHDRLVLEAKRQLVFSDQTVSEISWRLGFSSPSYFSRFFVTRTGEKPTDFRLRIRG